MSRVTVACLTVAAWMLASGWEAFGQVNVQTAPGFRRVPTFRSRPAISPFVNMFGPNTGGTNQYLSFVRPQLQLQQFNQIQQQQVGLLNQSLQMQQQILLNSYNPYGNTPQDNAVGGGGSLQLRPTSAVTPTATPHASYFNYSHYFNYPIQPTGSSVTGGRIR